MYISGISRLPSSSALPPHTITVLVVVHGLARALVLVPHGDAYGPRGVLDAVVVAIRLYRALGVARRVRVAAFGLAFLRLFLALFGLLGLFRLGDGRLILLLLDLQLDLLVLLVGEGLLAVGHPVCLPVWILIDEALFGFGKFLVNSWPLRKLICSIDAQGKFHLLLIKIGSSPIDME